MPILSMVSKLPKYVLKRNELLCSQINIHRNVNERFMILVLKCKKFKYTKTKDYIKHH